MGVNWIEVERLVRLAVAGRAPDDAATLLSRALAEDRDRYMAIRKAARADEAAAVNPLAVRPEE